MEAQGPADPLRPAEQTPIPVNCSGETIAIVSPSMAFLITENCIRCKFMDCVDVCPVDCFREGPTMLVIDPAVCIDCGICAPECPAHAIAQDSDAGIQGWAARNAKYASLWPAITSKGPAPDDAKAWNGATGKLLHSFGTHDPALA
jgi:ferredoxin